MEDLSSRTLPSQHAARHRGDDLPATACNAQAGAADGEETESTRSGGDETDVQELYKSVPSDPAPDIPPYWAARHGRSTSSASYQSLAEPRPAPIILEDHSDEQNEQSQGCWARCVTVGDYTIISGATGIGAYVVWHIRVHTLKGGCLTLRKRYSEFDQLRRDLVKSFPHAEQMIPPLPRKSVVSKFRPWFLQQRQAGLNHFLNCILLNPEFAASPVLKDFIFS